MSTGCEFGGDRLVRFAAGRLDPAARDRVAAHLPACAACRDELTVIRSLRSAPSTPPPGLEARIREAARTELRAVGAAASGPAPSPERGSGGRRPRIAAGRRWAPWALPLAAAAALAVVWIGVDTAGTGSGSVPADAGLEESFAPYGAWPAADGVVAGDPLLTELSVEELERLLEDMR